jgi:G:T-mismatch repair DNA endonuclease (very short patch repair protein)
VAVPAEPPRRHTPRKKEKYYFLFKKKMSNAAFNISLLVFIIIFRFLQSHDTLNLSSSFGFAFKVLSTEHASYRQTKKGNLKHFHTGAAPAHHLLYPNETRPVGFKCTGSGSRVSWYFDTCINGMPELDLLCVCTASVVGYYYRHYIKDKNSPEAQTFLEFSLAHGPKQQPKQKLLRLVQNLILELDLPKQGPHMLNEVIPKISNHYQAQFVIYSKERANKISFMHPPVFDRSKVPIFLYLTKAEDIDHVVPILLFKQFYRLKHLHCHFCDKVYRGKVFHHFCKKEQSCFACKRIYKKQGDWEDDELSDFTCNVRLVPEVEQNCQHCNMLLKSQQCASFHGANKSVSNCEKKGFLCTKCKKYVHISGKIKSSEAKKKHTCGTKFCQTCHKFYELHSDHQCPIKKVNPPVKWNNLGFISLFYKVNGTKEGFEHEVVSGVINFECNKKCRFSQELFLSDYFLSSSQNLPQPPPENMLFEYYDYLDTSLSEQEAKGRYNTNPSSNSKKDMTEKCMKSKNKGLIHSIFKRILNPTFQAYSFVCDSDGDLQILLSTLIELGITPQIVIDEKKFHYFFIREYNQIYLNRKSYVTGTSLDLLEIIETRNNMSYFPLEVLNNLPPNYEGLPPAIHLYDQFNFQDVDRYNIRRLYGSESKQWNLLKEWLDHIKTINLILTEAMLNFFKMAIDLQRNLTKAKECPELPEKLTEQTFFSPFQFPIVSSGSLVLQTFLYFNQTQQLTPLYALNDEYGPYSNNSSKGEMELVLYLAHFHKNEPIYSSYSNLGQKKFGVLKPDAYFPTLKRLIFYHGCWWHGCSDPNCPSLKHNKDMYNKKLGKTYKELQESFEKKVAKFKANCGNDHEVKVYYACEWNKLKEENASVIEFMKNVFMARPLKRMAIRESIFGGKAEVYSHVYDQSKEPTSTYSAIDKSSMYAGCMLNYSFPVDECFTVIGEDIQRIQIIHNESCYEMFYDQKRVEGVLQITIKADKSMKFPFLSMPDTNSEASVLERAAKGANSAVSPRSKKNFKRAYATCKKCLKARKQICNHGEEECIFEVTLTVVDLMYALKTGYSLIAVHEACLYYESSFIFRQYISSILKEKVRHSGIPAGKEPNQYTSEVNDFFNLTEEDKFTTSDIVYNKSKRAIYKLFSVALPGKLIQCNDDTTSQLVSSQEELEHIFLTEDIHRIENLTDEVLLIVSSSESRRKNISRNCILGSYILSYSKIEVHESLTKLTKAGAVITYSDTDSLHFIFKGPVPANLFKFSQLPGYWHSELKAENEEVVRYAAMGPKSYSLEVYNHDTKETRQEIKSKGLTLLNNQSTVCFETYWEFLNKATKHKKDSMKVLQLRKQRKCKIITPELKTNFVEITFNNQLSNKRKIDYESFNLITSPFGYTAKVRKIE